MAETESPITAETPHFVPETWSYKGVELDFMGVLHSLATFQNYKEEFKKRFEKADAILLEGAPRAEGIINNEGQISPEAIAEYLKVFKGATEADFKRSLVGTTLEFYSQLESMAGEMGKDIIIFDPYAMDATKAASNAELKRIETQLKWQKVATLIGAPLIVGSLASGLVAKDIVNKNVSRRTVIKGAAAAVAGGIMAVGAGSDNAEISRRENAKTLNSPNPLSPALWDLLDYRNNAIIFTFTKLADSGQLDAHIGAVYGDTHRAQLRSYLGKPWEMELKMNTIYQGMKEVAPPRYRRFSPQGNNTWIKTVDRVITK